MNLPPSLPSPSPTPAAEAPGARAVLARLDSEPRVFVVTPSFNQARYLRATVESVLAQDYPRLEYFVADGGSTDGSVEILRGYGDRLRWASGPDDGQAAVIADTWRATDADIVAWLNSDDTYQPGAVALAVQHLRQRPQAGMVYGKAWFVDEQGELLRPYPTFPFDAERLRTECFICQPATFLRRSVFERLALPDRQLHYCMDYDLWIRLSAEFELSFLEEYLACSRLHRETKSQRELSRVFAEIVHVTARAYGVAPRNWAVAQMIHLCKSKYGWMLRLLPRPARRRLQAKLVQRLEARYRGTLYSDGWAGTETLCKLTRGDDGRFGLVAESPYWPYQEPLEVAVETMSGEVLARHRVEQRGRFRLELAAPSPSPAAPDSMPVVLRASRTFVPNVTDLSPWDERPVSFMVR